MGGSKGLLCPGEEKAPPRSSTTSLDWRTVLFDPHLADLSLRLETVGIGGSALALLELISREPRDFDILAPVLPPEVAEASRRFARLKAGYEGTPLDLLPVGTDFQLRRRGEDERFAASMVRVPKGALRDRAEDVLAPQTLARRHAGYRKRVLRGPTWRAST